MAWKGGKGGKGGGEKGPKGVYQAHLKPAFSAEAAVPYKTVPCKFWPLGQCTKGDACTFIHPGAEAPPVRNFKTVPCKFWPLGQCTKGDACTFVHEGFEASWEVEPAWQAPAPQSHAAPYKEVACKFFAEGRCTRGDACTFLHPGEEPYGKSYGKAAAPVSKGYGKAAPYGGYGKAVPSPVGKGYAYGKAPVGMAKGLAKGEIIKGKGADKGKGKKGKNKGKGHLLPRTRISEDPIAGTVEEWKGKFGWIRPLEPLEHEKAERHGGRIFCGMDDIGDLEELTVGATVEFQVWEDASGLGAEEVIQY